ncbi:MAG: ribosomal biogenesis protein [Candidatus Methanoplasma sp.]|jgi:nucleolar protein 56|nr:ribosomal biogenesis protein [Candidatus Methanoplasma sp.]
MPVLVTKWFGAFLVDEKTGRILDKRLMPADPALAAEKLAEIQRGSLLPEERELASKAEKVSVSDRRQSELGRTVLYDSSFITPEKFGFTAETMHEVMVRLGRLRTSEPLPRDKSLVQAVRSLDDLIETANLLSERLHEWYGMHFPELADMARDRRYAELIADFGDRGRVTEALGAEIESMGADFGREDMEAVSRLAGLLRRVHEDLDRTEEYTSGIVAESCPNMISLVDGPLAARLISLAGGLERLASLPSSTVQLLGAEKAMFRHLRSGKKPPKHGVIYQHPAVHRAPYWQRGAVARALAGKLLTAAKLDAFGGEFMGDALRESFEARVAEIKSKRPDPPKRAQKKQGGGRRGGKRGGRGPRS